MGSRMMLVDGDGTVPLVSLGLLNSLFWKYKSHNPGNAKIVTREYPHLEGRAGATTTSSSSSNSNSNKNQPESVGPLNLERDRYGKEDENDYYNQLWQRMSIDSILRDGDSSANHVDILGRDWSC